MVAGALFVRRQRRLEDPLIDLSLFRVPAFSAALATNLVAFFVIFGMALFTAQYAQSVLGLLAADRRAADRVRGARLRRRLDARPRGSPPASPRPRCCRAGWLVGALGYLIVARPERR